MSFSYLLTNTLWVLPLVLQTAIAIGMLRRRLASSFPVFFTYTVVEVLGETITLFFKPNTYLYALIYWCKEGILVLLGLMVIFEVLGHIFPRSSSLRFVLNFMWIFAAITAVAALLMWIWATPSTGNDPVYEIIVLAERSVRLLQAFLLIGVIALMSRLGLTWHNQLVGITAGFGIYSALALACYELGPHSHLMSNTALVLINSAAYNLAAATWAFYLLRPAQVSAIDNLPKLNLAEWNNTVSTYITQWYRRS
jgi:hypothetical protein